MILLNESSKIVNQGKYINHVAIPIKAPRETQAVKISTSFGKVKFFALYDKRSKEMEIIENPVDKGGLVVRFLNTLGVGEVITLHMGKGAYNMAVSVGMKVYFAIDDKQTLDEVLSKY